LPVWSPADAGFVLELTHLPAQMYIVYFALFLVSSRKKKERKIEMQFLFFL